MYTVLLVIHTIIVLFLIGFVLLQRSDSDGLSGMSGGGGGGNFLTGRSAANFMTRTTAILATIFMVSSLVLAIMSNHGTHRSVLDAAPAPAAADAPKDAVKETPSVPKPE